MGVKVARQDDFYKQTGRVDDIYSDFNHAFRPHPSTGQITRKTNVDAIKLALRNLILTNKYERLRNPTYGSNLRRYLFEPIEPRIEQEIEQHIDTLIGNYEPRVNVIKTSVRASEEDQAVYITIRFNVVTAKDPQEMDLVLYRVR